MTQSQTPQEPPEKDDLPLGMVRMERADYPPIDPIARNQIVLMPSPYSPAADDGSEPTHCADFLNDR
jgi:hypothetical protein